MTYKYQILLNQSTNKFMEYAQGDELKPVATGEVTDENADDALEQLFFIFNMEHPDDYNDRSLSTGDVVKLTDDAGTETFHACATFGWEIRDVPTNIQNA